MKKGLIFYKIFIYSAISFVVLTSGITLFFQTKWGRDLFLRSFNEALEKNHWKVSFKDMGGLLPFVWNVTDLELTYKNEPLFTAKTVYFRPYLLRLLRKELSFHDLWVHKGHLFTENFPSQKKEASSSESQSLPIRLGFKSFKVKELTLSSVKEVSWNISGSLEMRKFLERIHAEVQFSRNGFPKSEVKASLYSEKIKGVFVKASIKVDQIEAFSPIFSFPFPMKSSSNLELKGSWKDFVALFSFSKERRALQGKLWGEVSSLEIPSSFRLGSYLVAPWNGNLSFTLYDDLSSEIQDFSLINPSLSAKGEAKLGKGGFFKEATLSLKSEELSTFNPFLFTVKGKVALEAHIQKEPLNYHSTLSIKADQLQLGSYPFSKIQLEGDAFFSTTSLSSNLKGKTELFNNEWASSCDILYPFSDSLQIENLFVTTPFLQLQGNLTLQDKLVLGKTHFLIQDLAKMEPFFPKYPLFGSAEGDLTFFEERKKQQLLIEADGFDLFFNPLHVIQAKVEARIADVTTAPYVQGYADFSKVHVSGVELESLSFSTSTQGEKWPFFLEGRGNEETSFRAEGFWLQKPSLFTVDLQRLSGRIFEKTLHLQKPATFLVEPNLISLTPVQIDLAGSSFFCETTLTPKEGFIQAKMNRFPMNFLSFNPFDITVGGNLSLDFSFSHKKKQREASLKGTIEEASILDLGEKDPLRIEGSFASNLEGEAFSFAGEIVTQETGKTSLSINAPLILEFFPFSYKIPEHGRLFGEFLYKGNVEEIFDYINFGPHRIKGEANCLVKVDGTKKNPHFEGFLTVEKGFYENYYTGAFLKNIEAFFEAEKGSLYLKKAKGEDLFGGSFSAKGKINLDPYQKLPYWFEASFSDLEMIHIDLVTAKAKGIVQIKGNKEKGIASGNVEITKADFTIPEKLPTFIPSLPITYINAPDKQKKQTVFYETKPAYPLYINLQVQAPGTIFLEGRGLTSEWSGKLSLGGTYNNIQTKGTVKIVKGDFLFAGKRFDLNQGLLTFTGKSSDLPYIDLSASLQESGITVIASLRGKINAPHLTFRSLPPLPVSSILSYLIFGQDISEISPLQVAQIAATAASLSGQGPDIFSLTKKKLGIDRLAVISTSSTEGEEVPALQVGKYLSKGILFSVSQGAAPSTSNVSVEVDLTHGFIFQAEALIQQEQGKFSLKWNKNY